MIPKLDDWRTRLEAYVAIAALRPFEAGIHDCGLYAAGAVEAQTGIDIAAEFRGRYTTIKGGLKLLLKAGFASHADFAASRLPEISPAMARIGDVAAVETGDEGIALMIVAGHRLIGAMPMGTGNLSRSLAVRAFAVGWQP